ncbi:luciferin sulfotransferase-like [Anopheles ziemanni]|uniref:luciferin sulfotransferase-like n=1 Tax=Anopheles coustani TaxID=139045 RepID=UPI00265944E0|nr:luciferin sulfotransferase-like [Anopheles coustani]XP_058173840.1 luciferin sulfotransferase-like [Anopheles ziemanni]
MFTFKPLTSEQAQAIQVPCNGPSIEVHLNDQSDLPSGDGTRKVAAYCVLNDNYKASAERIRNLTVYEDDLWIVTAPKCGTTWTQEMMWLVDHNLDYTAAAEVNLIARSIFLEFCTLVPKFEEDTIAAVERMQRPRHIKSHLPMALLPKQLWTVRPRIVYCARNPKDMVTSFYHHYCHLHGYRGTKEAFFEAILHDQVLYQPQIPHTLDFWSIRNEPNVLFIHYEEMKRDMAAVLVRASRFLDKSYTKEQLAQLEHHLSFDVMKNNNAANHTILLDTMQTLTGRDDGNPSGFRFMRKGKIGSHREELTDEYIAKLDTYIQQQLQGTDFRFME